MSNYRIRKKFTLEIAHQLSSSYSKDCSECIHGHSYTVELFLTSSTLNKDGMVLDFGLLKEFIKRMKNDWDHALILPIEMKDDFIELIKKKKLKKVLFMDKNPTAENMAMVIFEKLFHYLSKIIDIEYLDKMESTPQIEKVRVHETETGWAEYSME